MEIPFDLDFNIGVDSKSLKALVAKFDSDTFIGDIATLLTLIDTPRISIYPFQGLDSPYRQLTYLASLNLSSSPESVEFKEVESDEKWREIVLGMLKVRAGYYEELLPKNGTDENEFYKFYKVAMPVFNNYFDTGNLNFEEQELERVQRYFTPFDDIISRKTGLRTADFTYLYNTLFQLLEDKLNKVFLLRKNDPEVRDFLTKMKDADKLPHEWNYQGTSENVRWIVDHFKDRGSRFTVDLKELHAKVGEEKTSKFLSLLSITRSNDQDYLYYTQPNKILLRPIFNKPDGRILIIDIKQVIHSINRLLVNVMSESEKRETFFERRGKELQNKTVEILQDFLGDSAHVYNEYKVNGKAQDVLVLNKGLALIVENKTKKEFRFSGVPDTINIYQQFLGAFKKSIRDGYEQCWRIKDLFYYEDSFEITDLKNNPLYKVPTGKYKNVFSIVVTLDKFREPQINLPELLQLNEDDDFYPLSIAIDDLEVILLAMKQMKMNATHLIKYLRLREQLQGRLKSNDELEVWGSFMNNPAFEVPTNKEIHFQTFPEMTIMFDDLYERGLGFKNERSLEKKRSGNYMIYDVRKTMRFKPE